MLACHLCRNGSSCRDVQLEGEGPKKHHLYLQPPVQNQVQLEAFHSLPTIPRRAMLTSILMSQHVSSPAQTNAQSGPRGRPTRLVGRLAQSDVHRRRALQCELHPGLLRLPSKSQKEHPDILPL